MGYLLLLAAAPIVSVCVTVADKDAAGFKPANVAEMQDTAKDLTKRLGKKSKQGIAVATTGCHATARVVYRGLEKGAPVVSAHHGYGLTTKTTPETPLIRVELVVGEHVVPFEGRGLPDNPFAAFGQAASEVSDAVTAWIVANREALVK